MTKLEPYLKQAWAQKKKAALEADLAKSLTDIIDKPDSSYVSAALRTDIVNASSNVTKKKANLAASDKAWHQYDQFFTGSKDLMKVLEAIKFSPAELKAMIGQESGDLMISSSKLNTGAYQGIAQMGEKEAKEVGGKPADRKDPEKAILMAAKVLKNKITALGLTPDKCPSTDDYKKIALAAYNKGQGTLKNAMARAKKLGRNQFTWSELIKGDKKSPLYLAIKDTWKSSADAMFSEVKDYVDRIFMRL